MPKEYGAISQQVRGLEIDYTGPLPLYKSSKYAFACMVTAPGLMQAFPCCYANQASTLHGLEKLSTMNRYPRQTGCDWGSYFKSEDWARGLDIEWRFHLPCDRIGRKKQWNIKAAD